MKELNRRDFIKMGLLFGSGVFIHPNFQCEYRNVASSISKKEIATIIERALSKGVDFAEVFCENSIDNSITIATGIINHNKTQHINGLGLRTFIDDEMGYQWTEDFSDKGISYLISKVKGPTAFDKKVTFRVSKETSFPEISNIKISPDKTPIEKKIDYLREIEHLIYNYDTRVENVILLYQDKTQNVTIANSEGLFIKGKRCDIILIAIALVQHKGKYSIGCSFIGGNIGTEIFNHESPEKIAREAATEALKGMNPQPIPKKNIPIIFSNKSGVFHECLGHPLEARHRDGVFKDKLGEQLTAQHLTVIDDATIPGLGGSYSFDDEGTQSRRNILIENGVLKNFMYDRYYANKYGVESSANARRASYRYPPLVRMSNLIIEPGNIPFEEIIKETKEGILVMSSLGGGRSFIYKGSYMLPFYSAFYIADGKIAYPLQPFIYQGTTLKTLQNIDAICNDFIQLSTGRCGLEQNITVTYGAPSVKLIETEIMIPFDTNQLVETVKNLKI